MFQRGWWLMLAGLPATSVSDGFDPRSFLSVLLVVGLVIWGTAVFSRARQPLGAGYGGAGPGEMPQDEVPPALVGALVEGHGNARAIRTALLDMAIVGAVVIAPVDDRAIQIQLVDKSLLAESWQVLIWESLAEVANGDQVVTTQALGKTAASWEPIYDMLDAEVRQRGLATLAGDPPTHAHHATTAIEPGTALESGVVLMLVGLVGLAIPMLREFWFLIVVLGAALVIGGWGLRARVRFEHNQAQQLPVHLTPLGQRACAAWRDYAVHLRQGTIALVDPEMLLRYAPVLNSEQVILPWLITAARMGFVPTWLSQGMAAARAQGVTLSPFYVYWLALLHDDVDPALIQPLPADLHQQTIDDFRQPVGNLMPAPINAMPFLYPIAMPLYAPIFIPEQIPFGDPENQWLGGGAES